MYVDESGDTATEQEGGSRFLTLGGCIMGEKDKLPIEIKLRNIKTKYYFNPDVEIKSNFLRYANPDITDVDSPIKLKDRARYDELEKDVAALLKEIPVNVLAVVIDKKAFWQKYPSQNPYDTAYIFLLERFQTFLRFHGDAKGICIVDPREGRVEKHYIGPSLDKIHHSLRWDKSSNFKQCPNIIERVLFSTSYLSVGIQLADLYCYPVNHVFRYNKTKDEYWRYREITHPKLYFHTKKFSPNGDSTPTIDGTGLKYFPEYTKKDLRYFQQETRF